MSEDELPKGAVLIKDILDAVGVKHYEPAVVTQLLEFLYRYMSDVFQDAEKYNSSSSQDIGLESVMLAVHSQETVHFARPPPQEVLSELAEQRNRQPLPPLRKRFGLRLPPEEDCLLGANYQLRRSRDPAAAGAAAQPMEVEGGSAQGQSSLRQPHGASGRPHMEIVLQSSGDAGGQADVRVPQGSQSQGQGRAANLASEGQGTPAAADNGVEWL